MSKHKSKKTESLTGDFPKPDYNEWRQEVDKLLKGAPYEKVMPTPTYEGITLEPMYRKDDAASLEHSNVMPGEAPFVRATNLLGNFQRKREVAQEIRYPSPAEFNRALLADLKAGQTSVNLIVDSATKEGYDSDQSSETGRGGVAISTLDDLQTALNGVKLEDIPLHITCGASSIALTGLLSAIYEKTQIKTRKITGSLTADPIAELVVNGYLPMAMSDALNELAVSTIYWKTQAPQLSTIGIDCSVYTDAGASAVQELAFGLASGVFYIRQLQQRSVAIDDSASRMRFTLGLGSNFFMEIAKLRAARMLWAQVVGEFGGGETAQKMQIHVRTTTWNKTIYDPYVNMLRTTTEAFSGVLGGAESMHIAPFDETFRQSDDFSRRIARNTHYILDEESHLNQVIDPAGGSWYIENITKEIAEKAWTLFQQIEQMGGMLVALEKGFPQQETAKTAHARGSNLALRKDKLVGTNVYASTSEVPLDLRNFDRNAFIQDRKEYLSKWRKKRSLIQITQNSSVENLKNAALAGATIGNMFSSLHPSAEKMSVTPLNTHRGAEPFEKLRTTMEEYKKKHGKGIQVFLANIGSVAQFKPRADFSTGFFQIVGFDVINPAGYAIIDEAVSAASKSAAPIVVLCSTDQMYPEIVPEFTTKLKQTKPQTIVILAGYPKDYLDEFQKAGVDEFIHLRANAYDILSDLMHKTGGAQ
ncbi:MAG: acyl-CoA mutase large subunit family protein [Deferribacteres bacterium]|nr:acyl-CoA mutase large subunit family protein [candidate division KSB1 bacterium]MCB9501284.1 acyl-CoA mutase large subunit family protein [Deferribacteres bacterium]